MDNKAVIASHGQTDKENVGCTHKAKYHSSIKTVKPLIELEDSMLGESHSKTILHVLLIHENFKK